MKNNDFITPDNRSYKFRLGKHVASGLSGFVAGVLFASIVWILVAIYYKELIIGK